MKQTEMFCGEIGEGMLFHFYPSAAVVKMCGVSADKVHKVTVTEVSEVVEQTKATGTEAYFAWWDNEDQRFVHVYPSFLQVDVCFPYGVKGAQQAGKGMAYQVEVRIIE